MTDNASSPVAILGLGAMGYAMATNLINKGFTVYGFDVSQPAMERFANAGGQSATTAMQAVVNGDVVIVMVTSAEQVTSVMFDGSAAVDGLKLNATIIISSTVTPDYYEYVASFLAKECGRHDVHVLDSPVSGGVAGARTGTLSIYSSGSDAALNLAKPVLHALGTKVYTIPGGLGSGSKAKTCHQVLPEIDIALCAEAMAFAARAGLDTREVLHAVQTSDGRSWIVGDRVLHMIENDLFPYSVIPNSFKDSSIIMHTAAKIGLPMPLVSAALQVYQEGIHAGWARDDDSTLWRLYLPGHSEDAIYQQTLPSRPITRHKNIEIQDIVDIFAGVHLAASAEAMRFVHAVGLDADLMYEIICNAAGSNAQFVQSVPQMNKAAISLKDVDGSAGVCDRLRRAVFKANSIEAALPIASIALQMLLIDLASPESERGD